MKICVARKLKVLELLRKERYLFSMFKTLVWMKVPLFSMKITIIFFINPDSGHHVVGDEKTSVTMVLN